MIDMLTLPEFGPKSVFYSPGLRASEANTNKTTNSRYESEYSTTKTSEGFGTTVVWPSTIYFCYHAIFWLSQFNLMLKRTENLHLTGESFK